MLPRRPGDRVRQVGVDPLSPLRVGCTQEVKPYRDEKEVVAMRNLIQAFHDDDVKTFERILKVHTLYILYT